MKSQPTELAVAEIDAGSEPTSDGDPQAVTVAP